MTIFPSIFLILLLCVSPTLGDKTDDIRESCKEEMNDARRKGAKSNNIANMNELEYDMDLEKLIVDGKIAEKCHTYFDDAQDYDLAASTVLSQLGHEKLSMEPMRTKFACARIKCDSEYQIQFIANKPVMRRNSITHGTPGSKCLMGRVNKDGLCVKVSMPGQIPDNRVDGYARTTPPDDSKDSGSAGFSLIILSILMAIFNL